MAAPPDVPGLRKPIRVTIIPRSPDTGPFAFWGCRECSGPSSSGVVTVSPICFDTIAEACDAGLDHLNRCPAVQAATTRLLAAIHDHVAEDVMPCCGRGPETCLCAMEES